MHKINSFLQCTHRLTPAKNCEKGKVNWDIAITKEVNMQGSSLNITGHRQPLPNGKDKKIVTLLKCPVCGKHETSENNKFQIQDLDKSVICKHCKHSSQVKAWKCMCDAHWFTCDKHYHIVAKHVQHKPISIISATKPQKRKRTGIEGNLSICATYEDILQDDRRQHSDHVSHNGPSDDEIIDLGLPSWKKIRSQCLTSDLVRRFPESCTSGSPYS